MVKIVNLGSERTLFWITNQDGFMKNIYGVAAMDDEMGVERTEEKC